MSSVGKKLESLARRLRPYLNSKARAAYRDLAARGLSQREPGQPLVVFDFNDPAIDAVGGRYYFSLILDFLDAGYFPVFTARRQTVATFGTSRVKSQLLPKRMGMIRRPEDLKEPFVLLTDDPARKGAKVVKTDYTWRLADRPGEIAFPVFVHPQIAIRGGLPVAYDPEALRPARIFFGGNTSEGKYDKNVIGERYGMLTRREMLAAVEAEVPAGQTHRPEKAAEWLASDAFHPFVLCETQHCKIPPERWLEAMGRADFFLACPGVGMPLCHNLIESLAAGAVPILQYHRYLSPELVDGVNCLIFHDESSLRDVTRRVLEMPAAEILKLRGGAKAYYDAHQAPGKFAAKLADAEQATLLMNDYRVPRK